MMAADPKSDRLRLIIEPDDEFGHQGGAQDADAERARQRRPEDMIDLDRLDDSLGETVTDYEAVDYEFEDEEPTPRRRLLPAALAVIALLSFGSIAWYVYEVEFAGNMNQAIPLIQADAGPIKTRPASPGGIEVPHQDQLVLNQLAPDPDKPQVERLLPPPEVPKPPAAAAPPPVVGAPELAPPDAPGSLAAESQSGETQAQTDIAANGAGEGAPSAEVQTGLAPAAGPEPKIAEPPQAAAAVPEPKIAEPPPAPPAAAPAPSPPAQTAALQSGYMVQLASLKNKDLVGGEWLRLQQAFPSLLSGKKLVIQAADLGDRGTFHRVRAGYFPDQASAAAACAAFKAKDQACIVVSP